MQHDSPLIVTYTEMKANNRFSALILLSIYCWATILIGIQTWDGSSSYAQSASAHGIDRLQSTDLGISTAMDQRSGFSTYSGKLMIFSGLYGILPTDLADLYDHIPLKQFVQISQSIAFYSTWLKKLLFPNHYFW